MKLKGLFSEINEDFPNLVDDRQREIQDIVSFHGQLSWSDLHTKPEMQLRSEDVEKIWKDLLRLNNGEPCAYILGEKSFYKSEFLVKPGVLIPRPETELLVERALKITPEPKRFADLGAGTGCIGLSLAKEWPHAKGLLIDDSKKALAICRANVSKMDLSNVEILEAHINHEHPKDQGPFDLIVANPPYIAPNDARVESSVEKYEPHRALYAAEEGLAEIRQWLLWAETSLNTGGHYIFEFGQGQESKIRDIIPQDVWTIVECIEDYQKIPRFYLLRKSRND